MMGFHVCEYCETETSSGDVRLAFDSGRTWQVPDMILHYVADHGFQPDPFFVHDVLHATLSAGGRMQAKSAAPPIRVGYLSGNFPRGAVNETFFLRLWQVMRQASRQGHATQTRGL